MALKIDRSYETNKIIELLQVMEPNSVESFADLSEAAGFPISGASHYLASARRILIRERRMTFDILRRHGIKRLSDAGTVHCSDGRVQKMRRHTMRSLKFLSCADYEKLSQAERMRHATNATILAMSHKATSKKATELIQQKAAGIPLEFSLARALDFFKRNEPTQ